MTCMSKCICNIDTGLMFYFDKSITCLEKSIQFNIIEAGIAVMFTITFITISNYLKTICNY